MLSCFGMAMLVSALWAQVPAVERAQGAEPDVDTVVGEVEVVDEDDEGNVTAVSIYDSELGSVLVADNGKGRELLELVGSTVEATGMITELGDDQDFGYEIVVQTYVILED
jgi:hypothetical protein